MWWDYGTGWGWLAMMIGMAGFWILVAVVVVALFRTAGSSSARSESTDAREILEQRLARGEIDVDEYRQRLDALSKAHQ